MANEILTVGELALLLKVAEKTVYTTAQGAEVPAFKVRGQWRFRRRDVDAWIAGQVRRPATRSTRSAKVSLKQGTAHRS